MLTFQMVPSVETVWGSSYVRGLAVYRARVLFPWGRPDLWPLNWHTTCVLHWSTCRLGDGFMPNVGMCLGDTLGPY